MYTTPQSDSNFSESPQQASLSGSVNIYRCHGQSGRSGIFPASTAIGERASLGKVARGSVEEKLRCWSEFVDPITTVSIGSRSQQTLHNRLETGRAVHIAAASVSRGSRSPRLRLFIGRGKTTRRNGVNSSWNRFSRRRSAKRWISFLR